jgi:hypothetical protein
MPKNLRRDASEKGTRRSMPLEPIAKRRRWNLAPWVIHLQKCISPSIRAKEKTLVIENCKEDLE